RVDEAEDIISAAQREVLEETGYEFKNWRLVKVWQPHTKIEWFIHLFVAWDIVRTEAPHLDAGEKIAVEQMPFEKVKQLVFEKTGYLSGAQSIFENIQSAKDLRTLPEFVGQEIDVR